MAELVHSAQNFMNAEDAIIAKKRKRVERMEADPPRHPDQVLIQRRPRQERGRIETTGRRAHLQKGVNITRP